MATSSRPRVLLDACALIAIIKDEPVASRVDGLLAMLDRNGLEDLTEYQHRLNELSLGLERHREAEHCDGQLDLLEGAL